ncbi:MAG: aldo/keto reductase [Nitrososphaerales archaeon]
MIKGHATADETASFALESRVAAEGHFRRFFDLTLSSLGMGTYLGSIDEETDRLIEEALFRSIESHAINVIDTAINYRFQKSERCVYRALDRLIKQGIITRGHVFISTKSGYLAPDADYEGGYSRYIQEDLLEKKVIAQEDIIDSSHCMTVPYLAHELEKSRSNLGLETLDLLYIHNSAEAQIPVVGKQEFLSRLGEAFSFFENARKLGKIRDYGMATWTCFRDAPSEKDHLELEEIVDLAKSVGGETHGFHFIQFPYNIAMPEALVFRNQIVREKGQVGLLEACQLLGIGAFTSVPLLQGNLVRMARKLPKVDSLTPAQINLQFARSTPGVIAPLVGHKQPRNVGENLSLAKVSPMELSEFEKSFSTNR